MLENPLDISSPIKITLIYINDELMKFQSLSINNSIKNHFMEFTGGAKYKTIRDVILKYSDALLMMSIDLLFESNDNIHSLVFSPDLRSDNSILFATNAIGYRIDIENDHSHDVLRKFNAMSTSFKSTFYNQTSGIDRKKLETIQEELMGPKWVAERKANKVYKESLKSMGALCQF